MKEYKLLIPSVRNNDRQPHAVETIESFQDLLLDGFGGFTLGSPCMGKWRDDSGQVINDLSTPVYFAAETVVSAREVARQAAETFSQQCVYLRHPDGEAELIDHPNPESVAYVAPPRVAVPPDASELVGADGELLAGPRRD